MRLTKEMLDMLASRCPRIASEHSPPPRSRGATAGMGGFGGRKARLLLATFAASLAAACAEHHPLVKIEEEPFVLSEGPTPSQREAMARAEARALGMGGGDVSIARAPAPPPGGVAVGGGGGLSLGGGRTRIELVGPNRRVPLVHANIAGQPTLLLIDTGAFDHLLYAWFAHELQDGEASGKTGMVVDHANRGVPVERWNSLKLAIDGWSPLPSIRPIVVGDEQNRAPQALGIGGILSPQRLPTGSSLALDFPSGEMVEVDDGAANARLSAHGTSLGVAIRCGTQYVLPATVAGKEARLLVDTGSFTTDLKGSSPPGRALAGRSSVSRSIGTVGGAVETRALSDTEVRAGQLTVKLDVPIVSDQARPSRCPSDGVLGMDILGACVVVVDSARMRISCG